MTTQTNSSTASLDITNRDLGHYVNGEERKDSSGQSIEILSPRDGATIGSVPIANAQTVDEAVSFATAAAEEWGETPVKQRVQVLFKFKQLVEAQIDGLSNEISRECGKTHGEARAEIEKGLEVVEFAASLPQIIEGRTLEVSHGVDCSVKRYPLGVVAGISPFNFPAMVPLWMIPIALACGNAFIHKPSEQVPITPMRLANIWSEAGLPKGVFTVLNGDKSTVEHIVKHPGIEAIGFVGSSAVAKKVFHRGTAEGKRVLAMGGAKNHLVVVPDADTEITARNVVASFTGCAGQRCMAASVLILVGESDHILDAIVDVARNIRTGEDMGTVISNAAKERIVGYIDQAESQGASIVLDGRGVVVPGYENGSYVGPTIIDNVAPDSPCVSDEIFGPVLTVLHCDTLQEAIAIENKNPYGNAAAIYTNSGATARHFSDKANSGMIGINIGVPVPREPFSLGGWNDSRFGIGDITGHDAIAFWTKLKKITQKWTVQAGQNWMS